MKKFLNKQMKIFLGIAFLLPYVIGILMGYGYSKGIDLSVFPTAQMLYPAAGAMIAILVTRSKDSNIPRRFYYSFLVMTGLFIVAALASVLMPSPVWMGVVNIILMVGSVVSGILLLTEKKTKREAYGLKGKCLKASIAMVVLFIVLYVARTVISYAISNQIAIMGEVIKNPLVWISIVTLPISFILAFAAFFGEEYGWRYYLQPIMQKHFGMKKGILLAGIIWGLWHLPINFFYYANPSTGVISVCLQIITCIALGIFFAYAYMKTDNIWVPVVLHFLNNNLIPIITGTLSADVIQDQQVRWLDIPVSLLINGLFFGGFILTKYFKENNHRLPTPNERADRVTDRDKLQDIKYEEPEK